MRNYLSRVRQKLSWNHLIKSKSLYEADKDDGETFIFTNYFKFRTEQIPQKSFKQFIWSPQKGRITGKFNFVEANFAQNSLLRASHQQNAMLSHKTVEGESFEGRGEE